MFFDAGVIFEDRWTWGSIETDLGQTVCRVARLNGDFMLLTPPARDGAVQSVLEKRLGGAGTLTNITEKTAMLGLYGPNSFESMRGVLPFSIDELDRGDVSRMSFFMLVYDSAEQLAWGRGVE